MLPRFRPAARLLLLTPLCFAAVLLLPLAGCDRGSAPKLVGGAAPAFQIKDSGRTVSLDQFRGQIVVLNFWASWCAPCLEEIPSLEQLHQQQPKLAILAVATDQDQAAYRSFLTQHAVKLDTVLDPGQHATSAFPTDGVPETYILDRQGKIVRKFIGPQDWTSAPIEEYLSKL